MLLIRILPTYGLANITTTPRPEFPFDLSFVCTWGLRHVIQGAETLSRVILQLGQICHSTLCGGTIRTINACPDSLSALATGNSLCTKARLLVRLEASRHHVMPSFQRPISLRQASTGRFRLHASFVPELNPARSVMAPCTLGAILFIQQRPRYSVAQRGKARRMKGLHKKMFE